MSVHLLLPESPVSSLALPAPEAFVAHVNDSSYNKPLLFLVYGLLMIALLTVVTLAIAGV